MRRNPVKTARSIFLAAFSATVMASGCASVSMPEMSSIGLGADEAAPTTQQKAFRAEAEMFIAASAEVVEQGREERRFADWAVTLLGGELAETETTAAIGIKRCAFRQKPFAETVHA